MLQLIATEFITIKRRGDEHYWHINRVKDKHNPYADEQPLHRDISAWKGIPLYDSNHPRRFKARSQNKTKTSKPKNKSKSSKSNKSATVKKTKRKPKSK